MRRLPVLAPEPGGIPPDAGRPLAIIVPARNEAETVAAAISSMLANAPENSFVVAVDDRSTDGTGDVLDRLAAMDPDLRVIHIENLPPGWLGKNHAMMTGARAARQAWERAEIPRAGGWLLFTDADVVYAPGGIASALSHAERNGLDHLTLFPDLDARGFWEKVFTAAFMFLFGWRYGAWKVNDPESDAYIGVGAFNLVRAASYERMGGHARLPLDVTDDVRLAREMRAAGGRAGLAIGARLCTVRWQEGLSGLIRGLEKNGFAGVDYSVTRLVLSTAGMLLIASPFAGIFLTRGWARAANAASLAAIAAIGKQGEGLGGPRWPYAATFPLGTVLFLLALWRSAGITIANGGVQWRDTFYSLAELRAALHGSAK